MIGLMNVLSNAAIEGFDYQGKGVMKDAYK